MNDLETFIVGLNKIQLEYKKTTTTTTTTTKTAAASDDGNHLGNDADQQQSQELNEKLADYLFDGFGWQLIRSIYTQKVHINEILAEKLIDLLIQICGQLLTHLPSSSRYYEFILTTTNNDQYDHDDQLSSSNRQLVYMRLFEQQSPPSKHRHRKQHRRHHNDADHDDDDEAQDDQDATADHQHQHHHRKSANNNSNSVSVDDGELFCLNLPAKSGSLFHFLLVCLELYLRFNGGINRNVLMMTNAAAAIMNRKHHLLQQSQLSPPSTNNSASALARSHYSSILTEFSDILFNKMTKNNKRRDNQNMMISSFKLIYLNFLRKLFSLNFKNFHKQLHNPSSSLTTNSSSNISLKLPSNILFLDHFEQIAKSNDDDDDDETDKDKSNRRRSLNLELRKSLVKLIIDYCMDYAQTTNLIANQSSGSGGLASTMTTTASTAANQAAFDNLIYVLNQTSDFLISNLFSLDHSLVASAALDCFNFEQYSSSLPYWTKLGQLFVELKAYKNNFEHVQTCLRTKHTHASCKADIIEISSRHNEITVLNEAKLQLFRVAAAGSTAATQTGGGCVFAKLIRSLFKQFISLLVRRSLTATASFEIRMRSKRLINAMNELGVCTCISLNELLDLQKSTDDENTDAAATAAVYHYNEELNPLMCNYLLSYSNRQTNMNTMVIIDQDNNNNKEPQPSDFIRRPSTANLQHRRSTFFPLLLDQQLISSQNNNTSSFVFNGDDKHLASSNFFYETSYAILKSFDNKSLLLCKYLTKTLLSYFKFVSNAKSTAYSFKVSSTSSNNSSENTAEVTNSNNNHLQISTILNQFLQYKWMTYEITYLYQGVLKLLLPKVVGVILSEEADKSNNEELFGIYSCMFENICKYLNEFLILSNSTSSFNLSVDAITSGMTARTSTTSAANISTPATPILRSPPPPPETTQQHKQRHSIFHSLLVKQQHQQQPIATTIPKSLTTNSIVTAAAPLTGNISQSENSSMVLLSTNYQIESKINRRFIEFIERNSIELYKMVLNLSDSFKATKNVPISICSQLLLFKHQQQQQPQQTTTTTTTTTSKSSNDVIELTLSKSLIETIEQNDYLLNSYSVLDNLIELYIKCSIFRHCLNECQNFHLKLLGCLNSCFNVINNDENNEMTNQEEQQKRQRQKSRAHSSVSSSSQMMTLNDKKYLEILLDLIFVYFYFNRKKDLNDIYALMKLKLNEDPEFLLTYFNVMILSKAFKLNRALLLILNSEKCDANANASSSASSSVAAYSRLNSSNETANNNNEAAMTTNQASNHVDYDADEEMSMNENANDNTNDNLKEQQTRSFNGNNHLLPATYRYDLILFPRVLELCLHFILNTKQQEQTDRILLDQKNEAEFEEFERRRKEKNVIFASFMKRLLYLVESCSLNIQIIIENGFSQDLIDLVSKLSKDAKLCTNFAYKESLSSSDPNEEYEHQFAQYCFELLYYISLHEINESFLTQIFYLLLNNENSSFLAPLLTTTTTTPSNDHLNKAKSIVVKPSIATMSANLLFKLADNLQLFQSTHFLRLPHQTSQEPIDYLLQTSSAPKKWKVNLNYQPTITDQLNEKVNQALRQSDTDPASPTLKSNEPHLSRMLNESPAKICCLKLPIKLSHQQTSSSHHHQHQHQTSNSGSSGSGSHENSNLNSYSVCFMLRFDNNLINFSKSHGLNEMSSGGDRGAGRNALAAASYESYAHVLSISLETQSTSFEIWLNPNGNLLFIRRSGQTILFSVNLFQIQSNNWNFIYFDYTEEHLTSMNKSLCKISYRHNLNDLVEKEFEIYDSPNQISSSKSAANNAAAAAAIASTASTVAAGQLLVGHQEKRVELNHLFNYDLGQIVLSKDSNYSQEHLILIMQIMDTNFSLLDDLDEYEWDFLNGLCSSRVIENIERNAGDYINHIKLHTICRYHPRNPHIYGYSLPNAKTISFADVTTSTKSHQQSTLDIALAKIGGVRQFLLLIAKHVEDENNLLKNILAPNVGSTLIKSLLSAFAAQSNDYLTSLISLNALINLLNKRANFHLEFKQMDGYSMLQRIFISISPMLKFAILSNESLHKCNSTVQQIESLHSTYQRKLFVALLNGCFNKPVFCINNYANEKIDICFNQIRPSNHNASSSGNKNKNKNNKNSSMLSNSSHCIYLVNPHLLSKVIIEWTLWHPIDLISLIRRYAEKSSHRRQSMAGTGTGTGSSSGSGTNNSKIKANNNNLWKYLFLILDILLDSDLSQLYHSNVFIRYNLLDKLIHFLLDANGENYVFDANACSLFISIFKHFNTISSSKAITRQLFSSFTEYLNILHPETKAYITPNFYFNFNLNKPQPPPPSQPQQSTAVRTTSESASIDEQQQQQQQQQKQQQQQDNRSSTTTPNLDSIASALEEIESSSEQQRLMQQQDFFDITLSSPQSLDQQQLQQQQSPQLKPAPKRQLISLDRFQSNENENNFSQISAGLMEIMNDMLKVLPDSMVSEIINILRFESFIMFAMDDNQDKRFEAYRLFLSLIEKSSSFAYYVTSSLTSAAGAMVNVATNPAMIASQTSSLSRVFDQPNKEFLVYLFCNQLNEFEQNDPKFIESCMSMLLGQPFNFSNGKLWPDQSFLRAQSGHINSRQPYLLFLISLLNTAKKNTKLCNSCLRLINAIVDAEIVKIDYYIVRGGLVQIMFNLLKYYSNEDNQLIRRESCGCGSSSSATAAAGGENNDAPILENLKSLMCSVARQLLKLNENQDIDMLICFLNSLIYLCYDTANIGYERLNQNIKTIVLSIIQSTMSDINSISTVQETSTKASVILKKLLFPLMSSTASFSSALSSNNNSASSSSSSSKNNDSGGQSSSGITSTLFSGYNNNQSAASGQSGSSSSTVSIFESNLVFQKFIVFIVEFIYVIYDKLFDRPMNDASYDVSDELSIFSFAIIIHTLSIGLESSQNSKFQNLFKTNLNLIRMQFRRLLIFMMHPNHKLQTRLQLIKRLLNTPNCEQIFKCIFSVSDGGAQAANSFNMKLSIYLNALINNNSSSSANAAQSQQQQQQQQLTNSDKEILNHLNEILTNVGLNYKNELIFSMNKSNNMSLGGGNHHYLNFESNESIGSNIIATEQSSLLFQSPTSITSRRNTVSLSTQFDKEFDEEILKIYARSSKTFKAFLQRFNELTDELNRFSSSLNDQIVSIHSNVRKIYLQRLKEKRIEVYGIKQKWINLTENMMHERCVWHDSEHALHFYVLDQTEGPNRERRRLKKSKLDIDKRFFKSEQRLKLQQSSSSSSKNSSSSSGSGITPLKYLFDYFPDDLDFQSSNLNSSSAGEFMLYHFKEIYDLPVPCKNVMPSIEIKGELLISESRINFAADEKNYSFLVGIENISNSWSYDDIKDIHLRRYLLKDVGLELFLIYGHTILLAFNSTDDRNRIYRFILDKKPKNLVKTESINEATNLWKDCKISNYEYLMQLNKYSGRTFNDLMQYPVFPHVLANYSSDVLDLSLKENYRDLSKPIAIQSKEREEKFIQNYKMLQEAYDEPYHYASLYSNSGTVLHYLVRLPPFTKMFLDYQDQNFDVPDRTFHSMNTSWLLSSRESTTDYKELIPEFYFLHEFLTNSQGFNFGLRQNGEGIDNVVLPTWSQSNPRLFVTILRQALESNYVTCNLHNWIDLVFGYKQSGKAALEAINCYHPACYFGYPVEQITDTVHRKAIETMIKTWGQTPKQIFTSNHPQSSLINSIKRSTSNYMFNSSSTTTLPITPTATNTAVTNSATLLTSSTSSISSSPTHSATSPSITHLTASSSSSSSPFLMFSIFDNTRNLTSIHRLILNVKWGSYVGSLEQTAPPVCVWKESCKKNIVSLVSLSSNDVIGLSQQKCLLLERSKESGYKLVNSGDTVFMALVEWGFNDDYIKTKSEGDKPPLNLVPIRANENQVTCCSCIGSNYLVVGKKSGLISVYKLRKERNQVQCSDSFNHFHLFGHRQEITDIYVCLSYSTMATVSQDGLLIIWDTNKRSYVNSIQLKNQSIYKVCISETTNDIAFISNTPNKLNFYTGNCEFIADKDSFSDDQQSENVNMKSLCFSNAPEGLNVNVIAVGLSNGRIRLYSTWDLTLLRELTISYDANTVVGCIISLTFTKDCKRLYASDTYARVYILESAYAPAAISKVQQIQLASSYSLNTISASSSTPTGFLTNLVCFT